MFFIMAMYESDLHTNFVKSLILLLHSLGTFVIFLCLRKNVIFVCSYEGFYNFKHQHCPHLLIFIIEYFDLI